MMGALSLACVAGALVVEACPPVARLGAGTGAGAGAEEVGTAAGAPEMGRWRGLAKYGRWMLRSKTPRDGPRVVLGPLDAACDLELFAACVDAGMSARAAVVAVASASPAWQEAAALLGVGVPMDTAWAALRTQPHLTELVRLAQMSGDSGAAIASGCHRMVAQLRAEASAQALAAAERAGVFIAAPLAVCFLPAFIIVGLVPVIISLGQQLL